MIICISASADTLTQKKKHRGAPTVEENGEMKGRFVSLSILWSDHGRCLLILAEHWR